MTFKPLVLAAALAFIPCAGHAQASVHGTVFLDRNADGIQQRSEPGFRGVVVSNQDAVVITDSLGHFELRMAPTASSSYRRPSTIELPDHSGVTSAIRSA